MNQTYTGWLKTGRRQSTCPDCGCWFLKDGPRQVRCIPCAAEHKVKMDAAAWQRRKMRNAE